MTRDCLTCADALWLLEEGGESLENAARRMGMVRGSLVTHLARHGQRERIQRFVAADYERADQDRAARYTSARR